MTTEPSFDPSAPLAGAGDPWDSAPTPSWRAAPPYHMTDMIAAEPAVAKRTVERLAGTGPAADLAAAIRAALTAGEPVIVTGCGTSEHGAMAAVEILREAAVAAGLEGARVTSEQAFELALAPPPRGLVIGISHEGASRATNAALAAARNAGAQTAVITVSGGSPAGALAGIVVETGELDHGWCHTIGYLSPVVAAAAVGAHLSGRPLDAATRGRPGRRWHTRHRRRGADRRPVRGRSAPPGRRLRGRPAGGPRARAQGRGGSLAPVRIPRSRDLPARPPAGHRRGHGPRPHPDRSGSACRAAGTRRQALAAAKVIGLRSAAIVASGVDAELDPVLTPAGRLVITESPDLPAPVAALLGSATPLQLMTERLARARGTNPDLIRREDPVYLAAADAADAPSAADA